MDRITFLLFTLLAIGLYLFLHREHRVRRGDEQSYSREASDDVEARNPERSESATPSSDERPSKFTQAQPKSATSSDSVIATSNDSVTEAAVSSKYKIPQTPAKIELARTAENDLAAAGCSFGSHRIARSGNGVIDDELTCAQNVNPETQRLALHKYIDDLTTALKEAGSGEDNSVLYKKVAGANDILTSLVLAKIAQRNGNSRDGR